MQWRSRWGVQLIAADANVRRVQQEWCAALKFMRLRCTHTHTPDRRSLAHTLWPLFKWSRAWFFVVHQISWSVRRIHSSTGGGGERWRDLHGFGPFAGCSAQLLFMIPNSFTLAANAPGRTCNTRNMMANEIPVWAILFENFRTLPLHSANTAPCLWRMSDD